jgi:hypothetical protein
MESARKLLEDIAHCSIACDIRAGSKVHQACNTIVGLQTRDAFQLPEPWSGRIDTAPILFISSNPSIDPLERYPDESWEGELIIDFFQNRFTSKVGWVHKGLYALRRDGSRTDWVRFWASARSRASEILEKEKNAIVPGMDFALTEVVHCKSRNEVGVREAQDCCSNRYLTRVISVAAAEVLVVFGEIAAGAIRRRFGSSMKGENGLCVASIEGMTRVVAFLPHPNERGSKKSIEGTIGASGLSLIRSHLKVARANKT